MTTRPGEPEDQSLDPAPRIPLHELPDLPGRGAGYWSEPLLGGCIVIGLSTILVAATHAVTMARGNDGEDDHDFARTLMLLIWVEAATAIMSMSYLLFAGAGVIRRSEATCYPMPLEVGDRIRSNRTTEGMDNIKGNGRPGLPNGSYCVRCLVWRPEGKKAHHCNTCQRCVTGFDHHCGVFGRCIVLRNMPCFIYLIGMVFAGMITTMLSVAASSPGAAEIRT